MQPSKKKEKLTIYIAAHKRAGLPKVADYQPIEAGAMGKEHFLPLTDDTGDNISSRNDRFSELTVLYWIWRHDKTSRYIGLCHYRRYLRLYGDGGRDMFYACPGRMEALAREIAVSDAMREALRQGNAIVPVKCSLPLTVRQHYAKNHDGADLEILHQVLQELFPAYEGAWQYVMEQTGFHGCNMFVMERSRFEAYMAWLFAILFAVEKRIPSKADSYQNRTFGFMAERLLDVWLYANLVPYREVAVLSLGSREVEAQRLSLIVDKLDEAGVAACKEFSQQISIPADMALQAAAMPLERLYHERRCGDICLSAKYKLFFLQGMVMPGAGFVQELLQGFRQRQQLGAVAILGADDRLILAVQYNVDWRFDLFQDIGLLLCAQIFEFHRAGYEVEVRGAEALPVHISHALWQAPEPERQLFLHVYHAELAGQ